MGDDSRGRGGGPEGDDFCKMGVTKEGARQKKTLPRANPGYGDGGPGYLSERYLHQARFVVVTVHVGSAFVSEAR